MLYILVILIILVHIFFCFKSLAYGCAFFIAVKMIIPTPTRIGGLSLYAIMMIILLFFSLLKSDSWRKDKRNVKVSIFPFLSLILPISILGIFGIVDYSFQYYRLIQFTITEILPFFILIVGIKNKNDLDLCVKTLIYSYLIIGIWGGITYLMHMNLYVLVFANAFNYANEMFIGDGSEAIRGMLTSIATGNQAEGAIPWGQISLVMLTFGLFYKNINNKYVKICFVILAALNCFLSTKRSAIVPMLLLIGYILIEKGFLRRKYVIWGVSSLFVIGILFVFSPELRNIYHQNIEPSLFFWNDDLADKNEFSGSSKEMRIAQTIYVNNLISEHLFAGLGYGYPIVHNMKYQGATDALYFESLYLYVIVSSGYVGLIIWMIFFIKLIKKTRFACNSKFDNYALHGSYILSILLTNIYGSLAYYMIIMALFIKYRQFNVLFVKRINF